MGAPGFDDAPFVEFRRALTPHDVTFVYPYYENPRFLDRQLGEWSSYPECLRSRIKVIVVDDGSPNNPALTVLGNGRVLPLRVDLYRIEVDVRWNWLAARNIGAHYALDGWLMLTDMDHVVDAELAASLVDGFYDPGVIHRFSRREHTGAKIHPHPNSMYMTRAMFWKVGGYDEALSGHYGTDGDWRRRCAMTAPVRTLRGELIRHEYVDDSSTTTYKRKQPQDAAKKFIMARRKKGWRPKVLSFPYHREEL